LSAEAIREREGQLLRQLEDGIPDDRADRQAALLRVVERDTARLGRLQAAQEERDAADAADQADRLAFDAQPEGEQVRRHQFGSNRAINTLIKLGSAAAREIGPAPGAPGADGPPSVRATTGGEDGQEVEPSPAPSRSAAANSASASIVIGAPTTGRSDPDPQDLSPPTLDGPAAPHEAVRSVITSHAETRSRRGRAVRGKVGTVRRCSGGGLDRPGQ
jgi:hypothetical protein